jgi:hypothetical protein
MSRRTTFPGVGSEMYREAAVRRQMPRAGYVLAVSGALAVVTFTLVYLTTLSFASGI